MPWNRRVRFSYFLLPRCSCSPPRLVRLLAIHLPLLTRSSSIVRLQQMLLCRFISHKHTQTHRLSADLESQFSRDLLVSGYSMKQLWF
ncbi:hypothetical protein COMA2_90095 [Candidatus Nitrospira nitrificans]|uniref:Uncharacterized protein n=1 Tax=Candidatus Nitrospira nitrificans TaxID=1742973 RepID=A0A0S4LQZ6_9BACT|nr:hypothetical protein COMA2_90095 [Candidatus Nitrospira nitrificans]